MKKKVGTISLIMFLCLATAFPSFAAGWQNDSIGWRYEKEDGSYASFRWEQIDGNWYYFNGEGYMFTGWLQDGEYWYYLEESGRMLSSETREIDGVTYTFDETGKMLEPEATKEEMEQWFYATYAIIANQNSWNEEYFRSWPGIWESEGKYRLKIAWGITDKESAKRMVSRLKANGDYDKDAWDYCRAMQVIQEAYLSGYFTETEKLDMMLDVALAIQSSYSSWDEMTESYLDGYRYWSGTETGYQTRKQLYQDLKPRYYQIDWNMKLNKCW